MAQYNWEADKMLDVYIHDYLVKKNFNASAKAFMAEAKVATNSVAIDAPGGFLFEWWSVFWDIFIATRNEKHSESASAYIEAQQMKAKEQQQQQHLQQQQLQQKLQILQQRNIQMQRGVLNHHSLSGPGNGIIDANQIALLNTANVQQGQLGQNNSGTMGAALQQIQGRHHLKTDIKSDVILGPNQKQLPVDPSSVYAHTILQSKSGLGNSGINPLKGYPLTGANMGVQVQKPTLPVQNQYLLQAQQQQMMMSQIQQAASQQPDQLSQQQLPQKNRKRKQASSSGPVNSSGTGNTVGPSANSPPSTHTPGDGIGTAKNVMMYGTEGTGGGLTSSNQPDDIEQFGDVGCLEDHVESFLAHGRDIYGRNDETEPVRDRSEM